MQQTSLDRWLQRKFVHRTRIYCNTLPASLPPEAKTDEATAEKGGRYRYRIVAQDEATVRKIATALESENITYTSRVSDIEGLVTRLLANPQRSFTMTLLWIFLALVIIGVIVSGLPAQGWRWLTDKGPGAAPANSSVEINAKQRRGGSGGTSAAVSAKGSGGTSPAGAAAGGTKGGASGTGGPNVVVIMGKSGTESPGGSPGAKGGPSAAADKAAGEGGRPVHRIRFIIERIQSNERVIDPFGLAMAKGKEVPDLFVEVVEETVTEQPAAASNGLTARAVEQLPLTGIYRGSNRIVVRGRLHEAGDSIPLLIDGVEMKLVFVRVEPDGVRFRDAETGQEVLRPMRPSSLQLRPRPGSDLSGDKGIYPQPAQVPIRLSEP